MTTLRVRVSASGLYTLRREDYQEAWQEKCDEDGDMEEGNDYPPMPDSFVIEAFQESLEEGNEDLGEVLESADIDVKIA